MSGYLNSVLERANAWHFWIASYVSRRCVEKRPKIGVCCAAEEGRKLG